MKQLLDRILGHSLVLAIAAVVLGAAAMLVLIMIFDGSVDKKREGTEVISSLSGLEEGGLIEGEVIPVHIRSIPAPFISSEDGLPLGYVFLDITVEVIGEEARQAANTTLDDLVVDFTRQVSGQGVGMPSSPGVVDYERLGAMFMDLAQERIGASRVARVVILAAEEQ